MPLHLLDGFITSRTPPRSSQRRRTSAGMSENSRYWSRGCQIGPSVKVKPPASRSTGASRSIRSENSRRSAVWFIGRSLLSRREPVTLRQRLHDRPGHRIAQAADHLAALDHRRKIVDRQREARAGQHPFDRRLLLALGGAVIAGDARLHVA